MHSATNQTARSRRAESIFFGMTYVLTTRKDGASNWGASDHTHDTNRDKACDTGQGLARDTNPSLARDTNRSLARDTS